MVDRKWVFIRKACFFLHISFSILNETFQKTVNLTWDSSGYPSVSFSYQFPRAFNLVGIFLLTQAYEVRCCSKISYNTVYYVQYYVYRVPKFYERCYVPTLKIETNFHVLSMFFGFSHDFSPGPNTSYMNINYLKWHQSKKNENRKWIERYN